MKRFLKGVLRWTCTVLLAVPAAAVAQTDDSGFCEMHFEEMQARTSCDALSRAEVLEQTRVAATVCYVWMREERAWAALSEFLTRCNFRERMGESAGGTAAAAELIASGRCGMAPSQSYLLASSAFRGLGTLASQPGPPSAGELTRLEFIARVLDRLLLDAETCPIEQDDTLDSLFQTELEHIPVVARRFRDVVDDDLLLDLESARTGVAMYGGFRGYALRTLAIRQLIRGDEAGFLQVSMGALHDEVLRRRGEPHIFAQWAADTVYLALSQEDLPSALATAESAIDAFGGAADVPVNLAIAYRAAVAAEMGRTPALHQRTPEPPSWISAYLTHVQSGLAWRNERQQLEESVYDAPAPVTVLGAAKDGALHVVLEQDDTWNRIAWYSQLVRISNRTPHLLDDARDSIVPLLHHELASLDHPDTAEVHRWMGDDYGTVVLRLAPLRSDVVLDYMNATIRGDDAQEEWTTAGEQIRLRRWLGQDDDRLEHLLRAATALSERDVLGFRQAHQRLQAEYPLQEREHGTFERGLAFLEPRPPLPATLSLVPYASVGLMLETRAYQPQVLGLQGPGLQLQAGVRWRRWDVALQLRGAYGSAEGPHSLRYPTESLPFVALRQSRTFGWGVAGFYRFLDQGLQLQLGLVVGLEHQHHEVIASSVTGQPTLSSRMAGAEAGPALRLQHLVWPWRNNPTRGTWLGASGSATWVQGRLDQSRANGLRWATSAHLSIDMP